MKERICNWITTCIGVPILLFAVFMIYVDVKAYFDHVQALYSIGEILPTLGLGYAFLVAKDSLIEGISLGLFKKKT